MKDANIERLLRLVQKTGDTLVVSPASGEPVVIMPIERYEALFAEDSVEFRQVPARKPERVVEAPTPEPQTIEPISEPVPLVAEDGGGGEERFYLEPVE